MICKPVTSTPVHGACRTGAFESTTVHVLIGSSRKNPCDVWTKHQRWDRGLRPEPRCEIRRVHCGHSGRHLQVQPGNCYPKRVQPERFSGIVAFRILADGPTAFGAPAPMHQALMHGRTRSAGGCTEGDPPYREEDLAADRSHFGLWFA